MKKTTTVVLVGYDEKLDTGELTNPTSYDIVAETEAEAVEIAKKIYPKPNYLLKGIVETFKREDEPSYTVIFVSCYVAHDPAKQIYYEHVGLQLMAETGEEVLAKAKTITDKPFYKVTDIIQK